MAYSLYYANNGALWSDGVKKYTNKTEIPQHLVKEYQHPTSKE